MDKSKQRKAKRILRIGIVLMVVSIVLIFYLARPFVHETETYLLEPDVYSSTEVIP